MKFYQIKSYFDQYKLRRIDQYQGWWYKTADNLSHQVIDLYWDKKTKEITKYRMPNGYYISYESFSGGRTFQFSIRFNMYNWKTMDTFEEDWNNFWNTIVPAAESEVRLRVIKYKIQNLYKENDNE